MYKLFFKRFLDFIGAIIAIVLFSPLMIIASIIIWIQDFGPIIFKQRRTGVRGAEFNFYKFRSMPVNTPNVQSSETSKLSVTPFGKFIRRANIDELPQLFNILKGDMSMIGPRPPIPTQVALIKLRQDNGSLECRPGLMGLAQINAYDFMPESEKAKWDGIYSQDITFINDFLILFRTFGYLSKKPPTY